MKVIKEEINIIPDKSIFPKLGQTGYSIGEAIAEFVDNSIDARSSGRVIKISVKIDVERKFISIEDDGVGMGKEIAAKSIILGLSAKIGQLGHFGLGLKTAAMSLGKKFIIETTKKGIEEEYMLVFDEDEFLEKGDWSKFEISIKKGTEINCSGTKILIEKLRISLPSNIISSVKKQLRERFSPFILNKEVQIKLNDILLEPECTKIVSGTKKHFSINLSNGETIKMWAGILEIGSQEKSGFNLYRKRRLIRAHEKIGYQYHPSKMWVVGEIHLDCIPVTNNKREFITMDPLYTEFLEKFLDIIKPILSEAQQRHRERKIQDMPKEIRETLKDNILKALGKVEDFQELAFPTTELSIKRTKQNGKLSNMEMRVPREDIVEIKEKKEKRGNKQRVPKRTQIKRVRFITIAGKKYKFDYDWQELEDEVPKVSYIDKSRGLIMVILNSRFSTLSIVKDQIFYTTLFVTEGIVEVFLRENSRSFDRVIELRDKILKKLSEIITEDIGQDAMQKKSKLNEDKLSLFKKELTNKDIEKLSNRERDIIKLRLGVDGKVHTLQEIGKKLGLTRERIRQIEEKAISKVIY